MRALTTGVSWRVLVAASVYGLVECAALLKARWARKMKLH